MTAPACPECEKLHAVHEQSQKVGEFMEWLQQEKGIVLGKYHEHSEECDGEGGFRNCGLREGELFVTGISIQQLLAEFFEIDINKVEEERRALLEYLGRKQ